MAGRISTPQIFERSQTSVSSAREKEMVSAEKAATGKASLRPSEDPAGYMVANSLKDELSTLGTTIKTANAASKVLNITESVFSSLQDTIQRAYELAVAAAGQGVSSDATRKYTSSEVQTLYDSAIQVLNTRYGGRTLLAGFKSDKPAFDSQGNFLGDGGQIEIEVAKGLKIPINITGERAVLGKGIQGGINLLEPLKNFVLGLQTNNTQLIQSTLDGFTKANDQISLIRGEIGSRTAQIDRAVANSEQVKIDSISGISEIEDADAVKIFSELSRDQTVLKAAISTSQKILTENPTDIFYK
jgi:flagellar hook-associated protein 3 FlgL